MGHLDTDFDFACDREGCDKTNVAPAADSILSISIANRLGSTLSTSSNYYVQGTIVEVLDGKNLRIAAIKVTYEK